MNKDLQIAKKTVQTSINALKKLSSSFDRSSQFSKAVNLMCKTKNKMMNQNLQIVSPMLEFLFELFFLLFVNLYSFNVEKYPQ